MLNVVQSVCGFALFTDIVFALQIKIKEKDNIYSGDLFTTILFGSSILFIILPMFANIIQLHKEITSKWINDCNTKTIVAVWIQRNVKFLYFLSFITGNSFSALEICNSGLFGIIWFEMVCTMLYALYICV